MVEHIEMTNIEAAGIGAWDLVVGSNEIFYNDQWLHLVGFLPNEANFQKSFW